MIDPRAELFRHVTVDKAARYRAVMEAFAAAKRQFRLHLRPDELRAEAHWPGAQPDDAEVQTLLDALVEWGNLQAQPDTARVSTLEDFYRRRLLYRLTPGGEAVEAGLAAYASALQRRGELQSVALEDILARLDSLGALALGEPLDAAKVHEVLRDLGHVFAGLAENAEAFIAGLARTLELQRAEAQAVLQYKSRLIDYLERFIGDLLVRSGAIAARLVALDAAAPRLLAAAAEREARDAAPDDAAAEAHARDERRAAWEERWGGLRRWFLGAPGRPSQSELLRASARAAIPRLLQAVATLNERRAGRSDRAADFRRLALWFAACPDDAGAHRLWRSAYALAPARHLALAVQGETAATTAWRDAPPVAVHPKLRERGQYAGSNLPPKMHDRHAERSVLAARLRDEAAQTDAARRRLATGQACRLSEFGTLDARAFRLFLNLLGDALTAQTHPDQIVERSTGDGTLTVRLEPLDDGSVASLETELGVFSGRDHRVTVREAGFDG